MRLVTATVTGISEPNHGAQRLVIDSCDTNGEPLTGGALCYEALTPLCRIGDEVLVNVTAVDLGLGTGGFGFVVANLSRVVDKDAGIQEDGHIMKLRYTPFQHEVLSVEESASPYHELMQEAHSLAGMPVVCCELHSQVPLVAAAINQVAPQAKLAYCMTDEASLMAAFSTLISQMKDTGLIDVAITCGQAFGGDLEAVTLHSGLLAAHAVCGADIAIVAQGPGIVGTDTPFGHGGLAQAEALNAVAVLDGVPLAVPRLSFADTRERHRGVSHHTLMALGWVCLAQAVIPLPSDLSFEQRASIEQQLLDAGILDKHGMVTVDLDAATIDLRGLEVTTMGRTQAEDPAFFSAAYASGIFAAKMLSEKM